MVGTVANIQEYGMVVTLLSLDYGQERDVCHLKLQVGLENVVNLKESYPSPSHSM